MLNRENDGLGAKRLRGRHEERQERAKAGQGDATSKRNGAQHFELHSPKQGDREARFFVPCMRNCVCQTGRVGKARQQPPLQQSMRRRGAEGAR